ASPIAESASSVSSPAPPPPRRRRWAVLGNHDRVIERQSDGAIMPLSLRLAFSPSLRPRRIEFGHWTLDVGPFPKTPHNTSPTPPTHRSNNAHPKTAPTSPAARAPPQTENQPSSTA